MIHGGIPFIQKICGLEELPNLRVLMLGRNKIKSLFLCICFALGTIADKLIVLCHGCRQIQGLQSLSQLEVLDLHGNELSEIGLSHSLSLILTSTSLPFHFQLTK